MDTGYARRFVDLYLNKALAVLAVAFVAAIIVFGAGESPSRTAQLPPGGQLAGR